MVEGWVGWWVWPPPPPPHVQEVNSRWISQNPPVRWILVRHLHFPLSSRYYFKTAKSKMLQPVCCVSLTCKPCSRSPCACGLCSFDRTPTPKCTFALYPPPPRFPPWCHCVFTNGCCVCPGWVLRQSYNEVVFGEYWWKLCKCLWKLLLLRFMMIASVEHAQASVVISCLAPNYYASHCRSMHTCIHNSNTHTHTHSPNDQMKPYSICSTCAIGVF